MMNKKQESILFCSLFIMIIFETFFENPFSGSLFFSSSLMDYLQFFLCMLLFCINACNIVLYFFCMKNHWTLPRHLLSCFVFFIASILALHISFLTGFEKHFMFLNVINTVFLVLSIVIIHSFIKEIIKILHKSDEAIRLERQLQQSRTDIMMAQIQPHFLYNVLVSIKRLCLVNQKKAIESIDLFATFLCNNVEFFNEKKLIPFYMEMNHIRQYLQLEKLRFGDRVQYKFDIETEDFMLPPLTIQPLVENAIRHGITKKSAGGTVWITVKDLADVILISVRDDGVGFQTGQNTEADAGRERQHVGLLNVEERLKLQSDAVMKIKTELGEGTAVTIRLPKMKNER